VDRTRKPKAIDLIFEDGSGKSDSFPGIYELDGDMLKICSRFSKEGERPTKFTAEGIYHLLMLKKVKK